MSRAEVPVSEAAKAKADELLGSAGWEHTAAGQRIARFIQEVSDATKAAQERANGGYIATKAVLPLAPFILPEPVDPLVECMAELGHGLSRTAAAELREALAKRGLEIIQIGSGNE